MSRNFEFKGGEHQKCD